MTDPKAALDALTAAAQSVGSVITEQDTKLTSLSLSLDTATAANIALQAQLDTANATIAQLRAASDPWAKVDKTGATDVTAQVQQLIDQGLPVPAGKYLIDPVVSLKVTKNLTMDPQAFLLAKPNASPRTYVLLVSSTAPELTITGGQIIGDRIKHTYTAGSTHEWGMGIGIRGAKKVTIKGTRVSLCTGDGICSNGADVTLDGVVSVNNRRQAVSITGGTPTIIDGEYRDTGDLKDAAGVVINAGTKPMAGIDLEPDNPDTSQVVNARISGAKVTGNQGAGIESHKGVLNTTIENCAVTGNGTGMVIVGSQGGTITNCDVSGRWGSIRFGTDSNVAATGWTVSGGTATPKISIGTGCQVTVK